MRNVHNINSHPGLEKRKRSLEKELCLKFGDKETSALKSLPPIQVYTAYYKRFKKTYPLLQQLKTLAGKQSPLPTVSGLVDAMFLAEMKNLLLTAGHDLEKVAAPVIIDTSLGGERFVKLNREPQVLKPNDMIMADRKGVISSVLYGPDQRTKITLQTREVLFVVYAPDGIAKENVHQHLQDIRENVSLFSPQAEFASEKIYSSLGEETVNP
jgi:DNA/RNA-binding domain of Phe-tRNA-synthetase-like protein